MEAEFGLFVLYKEHRKSAEQEVIHYTAGPELVPRHGVAVCPVG